MEVGVSYELWVMSYGLWVKADRVAVFINNVLGENIYQTELITYNSKLYIKTREIHTVRLLKTEQGL